MALVHCDRIFCKAVFRGQLDPNPAPAPQVKEEIINFDARRVTPDLRAKVDKLVAAKPGSFEKESIFRWGRGCPAWAESRADG
jgi:hypothetical protein